jgi:hypothetical protein
MNAPLELSELQTQAKAYAKTYTNKADANGYC